MSFSQLSARSKSIFSSVQRGLIDSVKLSQAFYQRQPRPVTLHDARLVLQQSLQQESNVAASSLLKADREINLMKYHGIIDYMKQQKPLLSLFGKQQQNETSSGSDWSVSSGGQEKQKRTDASTARVAFMITKQQRVELMQECHFTQEEIKCLTPIQANIILQEKMSASDPNWKIQLDQILASQEKEKDSQDLVEAEESKSSSFGVDNTEKEELPMEKLHLDMDIGFEQKQLHESDEDKSNALAIVDTVDPAKDDLFTEQSNSSLPNTTRANTVNASESNEPSWSEESNEKTPSNSKIGSENDWYEVIESLRVKHDENDEMKDDISVVALFRTEEEAKECVEIKQELLEKRHDDMRKKSDDMDDASLEPEEETARFSYRIRDV